LAPRLTGRAKDRAAEKSKGERMGAIRHMKAGLGLAGAALLALAACGETTEDTGAAPGMDNASFKARQASTDDTRTVLAEELMMRGRSPTLNFSWHAPPELAAYPGLLDRLRSEAAAAEAEMRANARKHAQMLVENGEKARPLFYDQRWTVTLNSPTLLVLKSETDRYDGGAHGNRFYDSVFWSKAENRELQLRDLFVNWPEARETLTETYCTALAAEQAERRGEEPPADRAEDAADTDDFWTCPPLADQPVILDGRANDMRALYLTVLLAPYEAGPYAEGSYTIDVPLDGETRALFKAEFVPAG
jgi:hypothetical protein